MKEDTTLSEKSNGRPKGDTPSWLLDVRAYWAKQERIGQERARATEQLAVTSGVAEVA